MNMEKMIRKDNPFQLTSSVKSLSAIAKLKQPKGLVKLVSTILKYTLPKMRIWRLIWLQQKVNGKNLYMINKLMMDTTAVRQTSSCEDIRPKSSLESPGGPLLETTSNVVTGKTKDAVTPEPANGADNVTMDSDRGVVLKYMLEMPDNPRLVFNTGRTRWKSKNH